MSTNVALVERLECYMDELVGNFEDFVKKSLVVITIAVGGVIAVLIYALKIISDRQPETIPSRYSKSLHPIKTESEAGKCSKTCKSNVVQISDKFVNTVSISSEPSNDETISSVTLSTSSKSCPSSSSSLMRKVSPTRPSIPTTNDVTTNYPTRTFFPPKACPKILTTKNSCCSLCCTDDDRR